MIRVTVELVSAIHPSRSRLLGVAQISNTGIAPKGGFGYTIKLSKWAPKDAETWKGGNFDYENSEEGYLESFDRVKRGPWDLLYLALKAVVAARNW